MSGEKNLAARSIAVTRGVDKSAEDKYRRDQSIARQIPDRGYKRRLSFPKNAEKTARIIIFDLWHTKSTRENPVKREAPLY